MRSLLQVKSGLMVSHTPYMGRALELARRGGRAVAPNPMVGAVLVHNDAIIGEGYHQRYGGPHAEVFAIESVANRSLIPLSTLYVTLEPCSHFGKTPPCADLVIASGIREVVVGSRDPFAAVSGRGVAKLRDAGVTVHEGILEPECSFLNRRFMTTHRERRPYIILKWAQTSDGFIAPKSEEPFWITCDQSRALVHQWRAQEMGILVGWRTAAQDNPLLTVRLASGDNPVRIVLDRSLSLDPSLNVFGSEAPTLHFNTVRAGAQGSVERILIDNASWSIASICSRLAESKVTSVIVEGGAATIRSFIEAQMWDEARIFTAPASFSDGIKAPSLSGVLAGDSQVGSDRLQHIFNPETLRRFGLSDISLLKTATALVDA